MPLTGDNDNRRVRWWRLSALTVLALAVVRPAPCTAQNYDEELFIQGLAERRLDSVIEHLIANPPKHFDGRRILLKALTEHYLPTRTPQQFPDIYQRMLGMYDRLVQESPERQPILASDFSQGLLFGVLTGQQRTDLFLTWGVPTPTQTRLAWDLSSRSATLLEEAAGKWTQLQITMPRSPKFNDMVNTGTWGDLQSYGSRNVPYFLAWAKLYQACLPGTDAEQAKKLAQDGLNALGSVIDGYAAQIDGFKARCHLLRGRLLLIAEPDEAAAEFNKALDFDAQAVEPEVRWQARLGFIMDYRRKGESEKVEQRTKALLAEELTVKGLIYRILIYDNQVRALRAKMAKAKNEESKQELLVESYKPYEVLMADPKIPAELRDQVEAFIFERLATGIDPAGDTSKLPPMVQLAMATQNYNLGIGHFQNRRQAEMKQALTQAIKLLEPMAASQQITAGTKARAMQMLGASQYLTNQAKHSIETMIALADQFPDRNEGEAGIRAAVAWAEGLCNHPQVVNNPEAKKAAGKLFGQALNILVEKYGSIDLAADGWYMLGAFYREREQYPQAVQAYKKLAPDHRLIVDATYEKLVCMNAIWAESHDNLLTAEILSTIRTLQEQVERAMQGRVDAQRRQQLRRYMAQSILVRIAMMIETTSDFFAIERDLRELTGNYSDVQDLAMRVTVLQIRILQKQGKWAEAKTKLLALREKQRDKFGPLAVGVIENIFADINRARIDKDESTVRKLGDIADELAREVWTWVQQRSDFATLDEAEKIAYWLLPAKASEYAGKHKEAAKHYSAIRALKSGKNNIDAVVGLMESYFQIGEQLNAEARATEKPEEKQALEKQALAQYRPASALCNQIIESESEKKSRYYWHAQARLLAMVDRTTSQKVKPSIAKNIQRLQRDDAELGGDPWKSILMQLEAKHSQR